MRSETSIPEQILQYPLIKRLIQSQIEHISRVELEKEKSKFEHKLTHILNELQ